MKKRNRLLSVLLAAVLICSVCVPVLAATEQTAEQAMLDTAAYLQKAVPSPQVSSIGGEWSVIGLARSGADVPQSYYDGYYHNLEDFLKQCGGVMHRVKYTEYSRAILAVTAIGRDPHDVAGYDLVQPLGDFDATVRQGINGGIFALIALDSGNYEMPVNREATTQATRQMYVDFILDRELEGGGWALGRNSEAPESDITAMALQALSNYTDQPKVQSAVDRALGVLSQMQNADGSYASSASFGTPAPNTESVAQVLVALNALGIDLNDSRFVKNGNTVLDALLAFYKKGEGFTHDSAGSGEGGMSTEQGMYALASAWRAANGKNRLYDMTDAERPATPPAERFLDVNEGDWFYADVAYAVNRGLFNGVGGNRFAPGGSMNRAMLVTVLWRLAGKPAPKQASAFADLQAGQYYIDAVAWASENGIVEGYGNGKFGPKNNITREQMATILYRYAKWKGRDVSAANPLNGYTDANQISGFATAAMAWANAEGILTGRTAATLVPKGNATRAETAKMMRVFCEKVIG